MTEAEGFHEPDTPNPFLDAIAYEARRTTAIARLEAELASLRTELKAAESDLAAAEEALDRFARLVPVPGEAVVKRADLRAVLGLSTDAMTPEEREIFARLDQAAKEEL